MFTSREDRKTAKENKAKAYELLRKAIERNERLDELGR